MDESTRSSRPVPPRHRSGPSPLLDRREFIASAAATIAALGLAGSPALAGFSQDVAGANASRPDGASTPGGSPPGWFVFSPGNTADPGALGMADWLDRPAGRHGFATKRGSGIVFEDGTPVKFWGTNNVNLRVAPEPEEARRRTAWYAKYGVNAIRMHKFTGYGTGLGSAARSTRLEPPLLARMDGYVAALKGAGIYHTWSHIWGLRPRPGDRDRLLSYDEILAAKGAGFLSGSTYGVVNLFDDMQDLNIELTVNMLQHVNPFTGLRYADEPALALIELQNEDDAWWTAGDSLAHMPTYRARLEALFCDWLRAKYGTAERLSAAWGPHGLDLWPAWQKEERLAANNIFPLPDRRYYRPEAFATSPAPQRLLDAAQFIFERQSDFYRRFSDAIRATGYRGLLVGSNWRAGPGLTHYYNLLADAEVGVVDRHAYYAGNGHRLSDGMSTGDQRSMLERPDMGLLGAGFNQVRGCPFSLSEWTSKLPNPWIVEGPPVIAFYGLGLQGWDASFHFASDGFGFSRTIASPNVYDTNNPTQIGLFPLLARAVHRGDLRQGEPILPRRRVSLENLRLGRIGFLTEPPPGGDDLVQGALREDALTIGRVALEVVADRVTDGPPPPDLSPWRKGSVVLSNTGELRRNTADGGHFTVDTAGTKGVVGFASGGSHLLGAVAFTLESQYGVVLLTSRDRDRTLDDCRSALLVAMARAENSGEQLSADHTVLERVGGAPILLEGVRVTLAWPRLKGASVRVLDHDGGRTDREIPVQGMRVRLDGARDGTCWYEISWPARAATA